MWVHGIGMWVHGIGMCDEVRTLQQLGFGPWVLRRCWEFENLSRKAEHGAGTNEREAPC
ncbi:hypothetical protein KC19_8G073200 [Ceratodon purpureus]|uniref:Uncharacterized protein n=1 Tax=Ceratodon purpureus TaxID=3225 RepID=A0A8T0GW52_CERPU|nr:hypothetical protein KC19_8G073200 [Ceratodon purpureus]